MLRPMTNNYPHLLNLHLSIFRLKTKYFRYCFFSLTVILAINSSTNAQVEIADSLFATWLQSNYSNCMSGNILDTNCTQLMNPTILQTSFLNSGNITGIKYFKNLRRLTITGSLLQPLPVLPELPKKLRSLTINSRKVQSITSLPDTLTQLVVADNLLTVLPALPNTLNLLNVQSNNLSFLPALPNGLDSIIINNNMIQSLPNIPSQLKLLVLRENPIGLFIMSNALSNAQNLRKIDISSIKQSQNVPQTIIIGNLPNNITEIVCSENNNYRVNFSNMPSNLLRFICSSNNYVHENLDLPASLRYLHYANNYSMIGYPLFELPSNLDTLICYGSKINEISNFPNSIRYIDCSSNQINNLPALPVSLIYLKCSYLQLTSLPILPNNLRELYCNNNQITQLPDLNQNLLKLTCSQNPLGELPVIPSSLRELVCRFNNLTNLPLLNNLQTLDCQNNLLVELPVLPNSLRNLYCDNNNISTIDALNVGLQNLSCSSNVLDSLPQFPSSLRTLICSNNNLTSLPDLPSIFHRLTCNNNNLNSLPDLPHGLQRLLCQNNNITCMPIFPVSIFSSSSNFNISNNPFTCLPNYISPMNTQTLAYPLCTNDIFINPHNCPEAMGLIGYTYEDLDQNCAMDSVDNRLNNLRVRLYSNQNNYLAQTMSLSNGAFNFVLNTGSYYAKIDTANLGFYMSCPQQSDSIPFSLTPSSPLSSGSEIAFLCKPGFDVGVQSIVRCGWVFPGQTHHLKILAGDLSQWNSLNCAEGVAGQVKIVVAGAVSYVSASMAGLTPIISGDTITFDVPNFGDIDIFNQIRLYLTTDTTAQTGDMICASVKVTPQIGDNNANNNYLEYCYQVINSYDPNMKEVYPTKVEPGYSDWFTYTIHFQNTGAAPAFNIKLIDTLDARLNLETFEVINYSHANHFNLYNRNLSFYFPNIMLPDSTSDEDGSKGFIQFRIKPREGIENGEFIQNTAHIYFDFNEPIVTNTTKTRFFECTPYSIPLEETSCISYEINGETFYVSGNYLQQFTDIEGCDSLLAINVNILPKSSGNLFAYGCNELIINEQVYTSSGLYTQTLTNYLGCDSILNIHATINPKPEKPFILIYGDTLFSTATSGNQWYLNGNPIPGATEYFYIPQSHGFYTVITSNNQCSSDFSFYVEVSTTSINNWSQKDFNLYPNPNQGHFTIQMTNDFKGQWQLYNNLNQIVSKGAIYSKETYVTLAQTSAKGIYSLQIMDIHGKLISVRKIVVN
jgi:uncharacterized repeat protein (TIGR01451 family)